MCIVACRVEGKGRAAVPLQRVYRVHTYSGLRRRRVLPIPPSVPLSPINCIPHPKSHPPMWKTGHNPDCNPPSSTWHRGRSTINPSRRPTFPGYPTGVGTPLNPYDTQRGLCRSTTRRGQSAHLSRIHARASCNGGAEMGMGELFAGLRGGCILLFSPLHTVYFEVYLHRRIYTLGTLGEKPLGNYSTVECIQYTTMAATVARETWEQRLITHQPRVKPIRSP
jgi:hypothetical protein